MSWLDKILRRSDESKNKVWDFLDGSHEWKKLENVGYRTLSSCPEIVAGINRIADLVSSLTICLMENTDIGDQRVKNGLSRKLDIEPNKYMTRKTFIYNVVKTLLLEGEGNSVVLPRSRKGYLEDLKPISPYNVTFIDNEDGYGYMVQITDAKRRGNIKKYNPDSVLHFVLNPRTDRPWIGKGYNADLKPLSDILGKEGELKKKYYTSNYSPSVIVKVDALNEAMSDPESREKIIGDYVTTTTAGAPWIVPAEVFDVTSVDSLTLNDLAVNDSIDIDKGTAAAILGIPPFILGVGEYDPEEWNHFINTTIKHICDQLAQEFTRKLLVSEDMYITFNVRSLYHNDTATMAETYRTLASQGFVTGNEVRNILMLQPLPELNQLTALENYIPVSKLGDQAKLQNGNNNDSSTVETTEEETKPE